MPIYCNSIFLLKIEEQDCNDTLPENMILADGTMQRPIFSKQRVYKLTNMTYLLMVRRTWKVPQQQAGIPLSNYDMQS